MVEDNNKILDFLEENHFPEADVSALRGFQSRDGFQVIKDEDLSGMLHFFSQYPVDYEGIIPFMTDDNSNYLCVYFEGKDRGKVCYLSHDEYDLTPRFSSIKKLIGIV